MTYLVDKVAPGHSLYPADLKTRAKINSWLDYDAGSLCPILSSIQYGKYYYDKPVTPEDVVLLKRELQKLDSALMGRKYVVGEHRSVADLTLLSVVTTLSFLEEVDISEFHNIIRWKKGLRDELPYYDEINDVDRIMKMWKDVSGGKQVY